MLEPARKGGEVPVTVGVDTHLDEHVAVVLEPASICMRRDFVLAFEKCLSKRWGKDGPILHDRAGAARRRR